MEAQPQMTHPLLNVPPTLEELGPCPTREASTHAAGIVTVRMSLAQRDWLLKRATIDAKSMNSYCLDAIGIPRPPEPPPKAPGGQNELTR